MHRSSGSPHRSFRSTERKTTDQSFEVTIVGTVIAVSNVWPVSFLLTIEMRDSTIVMIISALVHEYVRVTNGYPHPLSYLAFEWYILWDEVFVARTVYRTHRSNGKCVRLLLQVCMYVCMYVSCIYKLDSGHALAIGDVSRAANPRSSIVSLTIASSSLLRAKYVLSSEAFTDNEEAQIDQISQSMHMLHNVLPSIRSHFPPRFYLGRVNFYSSIHQSGLKYGKLKFLAHPLIQH